MNRSLEGSVQKHLILLFHHFFFLPEGIWGEETRHEATPDSGMIVLFVLLLPEIPPTVHQSHKAMLSHDQLNQLLPPSRRIIRKHGNYQSTIVKMAMVEEIMITSILREGHRKRQSRWRRSGQTLNMPELLLLCSVHQPHFNDTV